MASLDSAVAVGQRARVLVVDDHPLFRLGLTQLLAAAEGLEVCGEAAEASAAIALLKSEAPDVVVVDLMLKGSNGLQLVKDIKVRAPHVPVLVLSVHDELLFGERALRAGAAGYVMKDAPVDRIVEAIAQIARGHLAVSASLSMRMLRRVTAVPSAASTSPIDLLTDRELEVVELIGRGRETREIASDLHVSAKTIETHRMRIKEKLGLVSANELLRNAVGWISERDDE